MTVTTELTDADIAFGPMSRPAPEAVHALLHPDEPFKGSTSAKSFAGALSEMRNTVLREDHIPRLTTGFPTLDRAMRGMQGGECLTILARPACLKTQLSLNVVDHFLHHRPGAAYLMVNLEMPATQLVMRQARMFFRQVEAVIERGLRNDSLDVERFCQFHQHLFLYDRGGVTLQQVEQVAGDLQRQLGPTPIDAIVIDHSGLLKVSRSASAYERATEVAIGLKQLARTLNTVVVALVQANRGAKTDTDPVPLEGARDSGAFEENADFVLSLGQLIDSPAVTRQPYIKARLAKNRRGPCVPVSLTFDPVSMRMAELDEHRG